jgi:uncharacterized protein
MAVNVITCPKCQAPMRSIERSVVVDRCTECGGLFLDRGELEKLMDAENAHNTGRGWRDDDEGEDSERRGYGGEDSERRGYGRRRRGGFLGGMFGGDD